MRLAFALERRLLPVPDSAPELVRAPQAFTGDWPESDLVIDFSHSEQALSAPAPHGVWRLSSFAPRACYAEARDFAAVTMVYLTRHDGGAEEVLAEAAFDGKFIATRNQGFVREKSVQLVLSRLARLVETGDTGPLPVATPVPRPFGVGDLPLYWARVARRTARRAWTSLEAKAGRRPGMFFLRLFDGSPLTIDPAKGRDLVPPRGVYWADPFLFEEGGEAFVFYEEYDYASGRGHLSVGRLEGDDLVPLGPCLKRPYHLSYPFVIRWQDDILMIPETHEAGQVEVWRATKFPTEWELVSTALEGVEAADNVVFERDGQWWLLTNVCTNSFGSMDSVLHIYQVDSPMLREVVAHPLNPVVVDTRTARGGGRVFVEDGKLIRASQENSHEIYGYAANLMEITRLDAHSYEERVLRRLRPEEGLIGCHHIDAIGGRVVMDMRLPLWGRR